MAEFMVLRFDGRRDPPWVPVAIVEKTLAEGGAAAIADVAPASPASPVRWMAVRFDDGVERISTMSLEPPS